MLLNTCSLEKYAQMRQRDMLASARMERLIEEAEGQKPKLGQKLTWRVGDWLIGLGHRLKHTQTVTPHLSDARHFDTGDFDYIR